MFPSNVRKYAFLGGVSKISVGGTVYNPDNDGLVEIPGTFVVNLSSPSENAYVMDKTWLEIKNAFVGGRPVIVKWTNDGGEYWSAVWAVGTYQGVYTVYENSGAEFTTDSEGGYPSSGLN